MKHDADDAIARLLRNAVEPGTPAGPCLDAEIVAAWFDRTLPAARQREAESHVSTCARCQALLATMAQVEPTSPPTRRSARVIRWFVPALVATAALVVWVDVERRSADVPLPHPDVTSAPLDKTTASAPAAETLEKRAAAAAAPESARAPRSEDKAGAPAEAVPLTANRKSQPLVHSPDGSLWRIDGDGRVSHSTDGGTTWREQRLGSSARLVAGSSPSPNVVWFAGAGGVVVVTADGVSWQWRSLPERVDITGIAAADGQTATVTTRDGRRFVTHDAGLTWVPASVQENPAAPF